LAAASPTAVATPAPATVDTREVTLTEADNGGWSAKVGITNLTNGPLGITATNPTCELKVGDGTPELNKAEHESVTVSIPAECKAAKSFSFSLIAGAGAGSQSWTITATAKKTSPVFWSALLSFLGALLAATVLVIGIFLVWESQTKAAEKAAFTPLTGLVATWTFKDSIVSNLTAAAGLVTLVLGASDFLKTVLGGEAESAIAVATIAGTIALALLGVAGVLVVTLKKPTEKSVTILGLCAGTIVALGAAGGQVWTITLLVSDLSIGDGARVIVWVACVLASALLMGYVYVSLTGLLELGTKRELDKDALASASPEVVGATVIAAATTGRPLTHESVTAMLKTITQTPPTNGGPPTRRSMVAAVQSDAVLALQQRSALP